MAVDERARHLLYRKLEQVLGAEEAGVLMAHLPPASYGELATKADLASLGNQLRAEMERLARRLIMWTSSMVLAAAALAFAAGRFA
jgi:S-adenosylmethionine:diacylglycerol 3-amino-3-carboxypropyl transferase